MYKIIFNATLFKYAYTKTSGRTGVFFVGYNILKELAKRNDFLIFLCSDEDCKEEIKIFYEKEYATYSNIKLYTNQDANFFFSPFFVIPEWAKKSDLICFNILYDTIPLLYPQYYPGIESDSDFFYLQMLDSYTKDIFHFSISQFTKEDFIRYVPNLDREKITVIPLAANENFYVNKKTEHLEFIKQKYNIPVYKKYLFSLCSLEERKNLIMAVRAFILFIEKNNISDLVYVLGGGVWADFIEKMETEIPFFDKYRNKIIRTGYVDDVDLACLYSNAEWFVYTSQYEGFGLPPLEAMQCGCPVITSNNSSLPEVVGDAGLLIDFDNLEQHVEAYELYYNNHDLLEENSKRGLEQVKLFTWKKCIDIIIDKIIELDSNQRRTPLVTVVTVVQNLLERGLKNCFLKCVESVNKQLYENIEYIIIDGASTDGTIDLLKSLKLKYYSESISCIYDAMNKGISRANGKYINFLGPDGFYYDEYAVAESIKKIELISSDFSYANAYISDETDSIVFDWVGNMNMLPFGKMPCFQTLFVNTDIVRQLEGFNLKYKFAADNNFLYKLYSQEKKGAYLERHIVNFRNTDFSKNSFDEIEKESIESFYNLCGKKNDLTVLDCRKLFYPNFMDVFPFEKKIEFGIRLKNKGWQKIYFQKLGDSLICECLTAQNKLENTRQELESVYSSKVWKVAKILRKIAVTVLPAEFINVFFKRRV